MLNSCLICFGLLLMIACGSSGVQAQSYLDGQTPRPPHWITPAPADGSTVPTNPPSYLWLPEPGAVSYILQYSRDKSFSENNSVTVSGLKYNMHHPSSKLSAGMWHWRYLAVGEDGEASEWSIVRQFTISRNAVDFRKSSIEEVLENLPDGRPRLFATPDTLTELRESTHKERKELWERLLSRIESDLDKPLPDEPEPYPGDVWDVELWRNYYRVAHGTADILEHLAFGYMITGEKRFADAAKVQMMNLISWDPHGTSSYRYNTEVAMPFLLSVSRAYDWIHDTLTPEERQQVLDVMSIRGNEIYNYLRSVPYDANPHISHPTRVLKFLGQASIAFMGELEDADEWLDWVLHVFFTIYPPWGDTDGSYSEGPNYWGAYQGHALQFVDALYTSTGIDLYQKPFFQNTGWWGLYCAPPFNAMLPFGDGHDLRPGTSQKALMHRLSSAYNNPYFRWYADSISANMPRNLMSFLWHDESVPSRPPDDLPPSRIFPDNGQAAFHNQIHDGDNNIMLLFKSSPFGAYSHAFAEQNSYYLQAFGEALAISSGYRPYWGSPHHREWTWQTKAHNSILVNGQGQDIRTMNSNGRIVDSMLTPWFDYVVGDATPAYGGRVDKFLRHVLFIRPDYFIMLDELETPEPATFDWLLHALEEMQIDEDGSRITIQRGDARLLTHLTHPAKLSFSQTDDFGVDEETNKPNQWHLTASTALPSQSMSFVAVMYPYRSTEESNLPQIRNIAAAGGAGVEVVRGSRRDVALLNRQSSPVRTAGIIADASVAVVRWENASITHAFAREGRSVQVDGRSLFAADNPVNIALKQGPRRTDLLVAASSETVLSLQVHPLLRSSDLRVLRNGRLLGNHQYALQEGGSLTIPLSAGESRISIDW